MPACTPSRIRAGLSFLLHPTWIARLADGPASSPSCRCAPSVCLENLASPFLTSRPGNAIRTLRCFQNVATTFLNCRLDGSPLSSLYPGSGRRLENFERLLPRTRTAHPHRHFATGPLALYVGSALPAGFVARALTILFRPLLNRIRAVQKPSFASAEPFVRSSFPSQIRVGFSWTSGDRRKVFVDFFRHQPVLGCPCLLACRSGAPVLPVYILREPSASSTDVHRAGDPGDPDRSAGP